MKFWSEASNFVMVCYSTFSAGATMPPRHWHLSGTVFIMNSCLADIRIAACGSWNDDAWVLETTLRCTHNLDRNLKKKKTIYRLCQIISCLYKLFDNWNNIRDEMKSKFIIIVSTTCCKNNSNSNISTALIFFSPYLHALCTLIVGIYF